MSTDLIHSLRVRGTTVSSLSQKLDVHRQCVYDALGGKGVRRVRVAIALIIGIPPSSLFPNLSKNAKIIDDSDFYRLKNENNSTVSS